MGSSMMVCDGLFKNMLSSINGRQRRISATLRLKSISIKSFAQQSKKHQYLMAAISEMKESVMAKMVDAGNICISNIARSGVWHNYGSAVMWIASASTSTNRAAMVARAVALDMLKRIIACRVVTSRCDNNDNALLRAARAWCASGARSA